MTGPSSRVPQLDGLRGIAILLIVTYHYVALPLDNPSDPATVFLKTALNLTWSGVDLFFVLSGFLVGGILLDHLGSPNYYRVFFLRRAARILPLYFAWIGLFVLVGLTFPSLSLFRDAHPLWVYLLFLQNFALGIWGKWGGGWLSVTWSLAVEVQFYLIVPLLIRRVPLRRLPHVLVTLIVLAPFIRTLLVFSGLFVAASYALLPARMDALLLGVLCAWMLRDPATHSYLRNHYTELCRIAGLVGAIDLFFLFQQPPMFAPPTVIIGYSLLDVLYACLLLIVLLDHDHILSRLTRIAALTKLGVLAYGIFLFHLQVIGFARALFLQPETSLQSPAAAAVTLPAFLVTLALATLSWNAFEKKILDRTHQVQYGSMSSALAVPAPNPPEGAAIL